MCSSGPTLAEPRNIMCSKRCAKPVRPFFSSFEPTRYQTCTLTTGRDVSGASTTCRPFSSVCDSIVRLGGVTGACATASEGVRIARRAPAVSTPAVERCRIKCPSRTSAGYHFRAGFSDLDVRCAACILTASFKDEDETAFSMAGSPRTLRRRRRGGSCALVVLREIRPCDVPANLDTTGQAGGSAAWHGGGVVC